MIIYKLTFLIFSFILLGNDNVYAQWRFSLHKVNKNSFTLI